jgi:hypothetical protein
VPKTTFCLLFDLAVRYALNPRFAEARYSGTIDGLVQYLTNLASPRMVSGRVYGGFGTVRTFIWTMQQMVQFLADAQAVEVFEKAAHAFDGELDLGPAVTRLRDILGVVVTAFETLLLKLECDPGQQGQGPRQKHG